MPAIKSKVTILNKGKKATTKKHQLKKSPVKKYNAQFKKVASKAKLAKTKKKN